MGHPYSRGEGEVSLGENCIVAKKSKNPGHGTSC